MLQREFLIAAKKTWIIETSLEEFVKKKQKTNKIDVSSAD
jgi:hypothetical protein